MRPQQQNRRMRGRGGNNNNNNNSNRKGPNPLTRSYESNGPDVKIRGTAQQVAEKYTTLARDAQSSGDRVMAENYLQHAEHYNRIIAAAMAQQQQFQQQRDSQDDFDDDGDDDRAERDQRGGDYHHQPQQQQHSHQVNGFGPQPVIEAMPAPAETAYQAPAAEPQPHVPSNEPEAPASGNDDGNGHARQAEGEEAAPRRARRPRRPRSRADQAPEEAGASADGEQPAVEAPQAPEAAE